MKGWIAGTLLATLAAVAIGTGTIAQEEPPNPTPEPATETTANVEVRVWQDVRDARSIYISARPEGGSWATLGTIPLPLDDGHSGSGRFRYGDITVEVPVPLPSAPTATPTPTPTPTPWVDPRPADTYTLAQLADMPAPRAPEAPPKPEHVLALDIELWRAGVEIYLVDDASRVMVMLSQTYNSRNYPVTCALLDQRWSYLDCEYSSDAPLNSSGTRRIGFNGDDGSTVFVSASLDGELLVCEETRYDGWWYYHEWLWWCYDPDTYRAWEAARDRALAPPDDPLQRYLREQGDPPLWYDEPPFERIDTSTTGVFRMKPYVNYEFGGELFGEEDNDSPHGPVAVWIQCVPVDRNGRAVISADTLVRTLISRERYFVRQENLCEFDVRVGNWWEGVVTITFAPEDGP